MAESKMSDMIRASLDGIKDFTDVDTVFGKAITTPGGVTVIPVSKISVGFATGGLDFQSKRPISPTNFGGGSGTGVSIAPVAFLTVGRNGEINLIQISSSEKGTFDKAFDLIENSPAILEKIKNTFSS
ncbi:MAG: sporulation protein YtfJ [Clostridia bacterium]|nr:sporulation protein YtfJ [Clostridia bacterium]